MAVLAIRFYLRTSGILPFREMMDGTSLPETNAAVAALFCIEKMVFTKIVSL